MTDTMGLQFSKYMFKETYILPYQNYILIYIHRWCPATHYDILTEFAVYWEMYV